MENLFENVVAWKKSNVKVKSIQKYALQCDKITYWCDEIKMISQGDYLINCPCFQKIVYNGTNSKDVVLDCSQFENCVFDSITITLDVFETCQLYKVVWVYEWKAYDLVDFRFWSLDSKKAKQNWYLSDILVHWKAWRLQVVSGWKFNIMDFLVDLITYDCQHKEKYIVAFWEYYITRFDFRIDFFHKNEIKHLKYDDVYTYNARKDKDNLVVDKKSKKMYTWWCAWNRKDKYVYTRMYQKQIEALDKGHWELYIDYLEYEWKVRRLEFEFWSKFTTARKKISFIDEFVNHDLSKQVFEYIWLSEVNWYFSKPKNKIEVPFNKLSAHQKKRYITQLENCAKKIYNGGINPYTIVNKAMLDLHPWSDRQLIEGLMEDSIWSCETYEKIMEGIEKSKISTKELYDRIYKGQLGVDL